MKHAACLIATWLAAATLAQAQPPEPPRGSLWQRLTPDQREQLWRSLTPEQKADLWRYRGETQDRGPMRDRPALPEVGPDGPGGMSRRGFERGDGPPRMMMSPEERRQMREQIREAYRQRRERLDAERAQRRGRE